MKAVPVAEKLGLRCPKCRTQLEDRVGPFWCPGCPRSVSVFEIIDEILEERQEL